MAKWYDRESPICKIILTIVPRKRVYRVEPHPPVSAGAGRYLSHLMTRCQTPWRSLWRSRSVRRDSVTLREARLRPGLVTSGSRGHRGPLFIPATGDVSPSPIYLCLGAPPNQPAVSGAGHSWQLFIAWYSNCSGMWSRYNGSDKKDNGASKSH